MDVIKKSEQTIEAMGCAGYRIKLPQAIGSLIHEPTKSVISVYKPINLLQRFMLKVCFGLKYQSK